MAVQKFPMRMLERALRLWAGCRDEEILEV